MSTPAKEEQVNAPAQKKNRYKYDGIKRVGELERAYRRTPVDSITLWIKEINTAEEIPGYVDNTDGFEGLYEYGNDVNITDPIYVEFEKKTAVGGSKSKAVKISQLYLKNKSGIENFKKIPGNVVIADGIYKEYVMLLEKCLEHRGLNSMEIKNYVLINRGVNGVNVDGSFMSLILDCFIDKTIDENEAKRLFSLCFEQASPKNDLFCKKKKEVFFEYMPFLLKNYPDKKDLFFNESIELPSDFKNSGDEEIMGFINDHLSDKEDSERIKPLVQCLNYRILLAHPEYENYANGIQRNALDEERKRLKEENKRKEEEEEKRKEEVREISKIIEKRGIENFVHFTDVENLESIMENGILSINELENRKLQYKNSDEERFDLIHDGISISVSFPNCEMLYQKRKRDKNRKWCILLLDPKKIIEKKCLYFEHNAASGRFSNIKGRYAAEDYFEHFFDEIVYGKDTNIEIHRNFPSKKECLKYATSMQAEIACFDEITPDCIKKCVFENESVCNKYKGIVEAQGIITEVDNRWFFTYGPYSK